jgi:hypothetical protein
MARRLKSGLRKIDKEHNIRVNAIIEKLIAERQLAGQAKAGPSAFGQVVKEVEKPKKAPTPAEKKVSEDYLRELAQAPKHKYEEDDED